jgi:hypothetical protein
MRIVTPPLERSWGKHPVMREKVVAVNETYQAGMRARKIAIWAFSSLS